MADKKLELDELGDAGAPAGAPADATPGSSTDVASGSPTDVASGSGLDAVYDIPVQVSAVLGRATLQVGELLKLERGAVIELDRRVGEKVDIYVNDRLVARGAIAVVDDRLAVTMTEIVKSERR